MKTDGSVVADRFQIARNPDWALGETQPQLTGFVGLAAILLCAAIVVPLNFHKTFEGNPIYDLRKILILIFVFASMAAVEIGIYKVHRRNFDFSRARPIDWAAKVRIVHRITALAICLSILCPFFIVCNRWLGYFTIYFYVSLPFIFTIAPLYFVMVEKHCKLEMLEDELLLFSRTLFRLIGKVTRLSKKPFTLGVEEKAHLINLFRTLGIKGFWIPFMVISCVTFWGFWEIDTALILKSNNLTPPFGSPEYAHLLKLCFHALFDLSVLIDVTMAVLGYLVSFRLLDNQFVSVEPTILGWVVAIICYPPFNELFDNVGIHMSHFELQEAAFIQNPILSLVLSGVMILSIAFYTWATVVFGLRFANLANRGVVCSGPYRYIRHPAYMGKNIGWWLTFVPIAGSNAEFSIKAFLFLLTYNFLYVLRALTEERHMMREKHYQEYCERVPWRFIPGVW